MADNTERKPRLQGRQGKPFKTPNPQRLENIALHYLGRFAASEASLRRVLQNRIRRAAMRLPEFAADEGLQQKLSATIESIVEKYRKTGVLNDTAYAEMKTRSLRRAGRSAQAIRMKLATKGIARTTIDGALTDNEDETFEEAELRAAHSLARRKRLGRYRQKPAVEDQARKDLTAMARAGFSLDVARQVLKTSRDVNFSDEGSEF